MRFLWRAVTDAGCFVGWTVSAPLRHRGRAELTMATSLRSILVFNDVRGLGNLVQLSGLLLNLRRLYPDATISLAMPSSPLARSVVGPELADELLFFNESSRRSLLSFAWRVLRPRHFDLALGTFFSPTLLTSCMLALAGCRYRVAYAQDERRGLFNTITLVDRGGHELDRHLRLLGFTGKQLDRSTRVVVAPERAQEATAFLARCGLGIDRPLLGIHPGCDRVNALKRWPIERFIEVIDRVVTEELADVVVFLGPDDMDLQAPLAAHPEPRVALIASESFDRVAALIAQCDAFLSNDSGLMHVAAAVNVPVVAIFGPTDTVKNAPAGSATILTAAGVPCRPCNHGGPVSCTQERRYCLEGVSVTDVRRALSNVLTRARSKTGYAFEAATPRRAGHAI